MGVLRGEIRYGSTWPGVGIASRIFEILTAWTIYIYSFDVVLWLTKSGGKTGLQRRERGKNCLGLLHVGSMERLSASKSRPNLPLCKQTSAS